MKYIINEPTAAALYYAFHSGRDLDGTYAVYDLGGGTFDISIIKVSGKDVEVLSTEGVSTLGGDDFDRALQNLVAEEYKKETGSNLDKEDYEIISAEEDKKSLSRREEVKINVRSSGGRATVTISRKAFEESIKKDLDKYLDGPARKKIEDTEKDLKFWMASLEITEKGILTKEDQTRLITEFGEISVKKLISMLDGMDISEVRELLKSKVNQSISELAILTPDSIDKRFYDLKDKVSKSFS